MTDHARAIETGARAAASVQGDDFDKIPRDKPHWIEERGLFNDRYRDINEPFQSCYLAMSEAVIKAAIASGALVPASADNTTLATSATNRIAKVVSMSPETRDDVHGIIQETLAGLAPASVDYVVVPRSDLQVVVDIAGRNEAAPEIGRVRAMLNAASSNGDGK